MRLADRLIVLDNGRIAETGTYDQLIGRDSLLSQLIQVTPRACSG
ncbi:MAG TPA: hypothetical protein VMC83_11105 [Streptosporangiaceae bacterium]|nr:hypothetical protein [Streptosporangiaceae bacterium]